MSPTPGAPNQNEEKKPTIPLEEKYWNNLIKLLDRGHVIPFISNSLCRDRVFKTGVVDDKGANAERQVESAGSIAPLSTVDEDLAKNWADEVVYPFPNRTRLAWVAQYHLIENWGALPEPAKADYLNFLKETLLQRAAGRYDPKKVDPKKHSFSDIARQLDDPQSRSQGEDSLRLLAGFRQLKIYVTTSYFDFIERALETKGRTPRTQICFWSGGGQAGVETSHQLDRGYSPSPEEPVVFHLFGHEKYPETMVLTEDDYVDFLLAVTKPPDPEAPIIPLYLKRALNNSTLLLLGYRLWDWDFRTLLRGIILGQGDSPHRGLRLALQLKPGPKDGIADEHIEKAKAYLKKYFKSRTFTVVWEDPDAFIKELAKQLGGTNRS